MFEMQKAGLAGLRPARRKPRLRRDRAFLPYNDVRRNHCALVQGVDADVELMAAVLATVELVLEFSLA